MILFVSRIIIAAYFLFSAVNKMFFFGIFSRFLGTFSGVGPFWSSLAAGAVIALECLFAVLLVYSLKKRLLQSLGLLLSVPFIIYNSYIYFVLNYQSCNCSYSTSGESLTHPLFSIFVLLVTLVVTFLGTREKTIKEMEKSRFWMTTSFIIILVLAVVVNLMIWFNYTSANLGIFDSLQRENVKEVNNADGERFKVYLYLGKSSLALTVQHLSSLLQASGKNTDFHLIVKKGALNNETINNLGGEDQLFLYYYSSDEELSATSLGLQVNLGSELIFKRDSLPEMTGEIYFQLKEKLIEKGFVKPDSQTQTQDYFNNLTQFLSDYNQEEDLILLLMDRVCRDCDSELLALLESFTWDNEKLHLKKVYFINDFVEEENSLVIPPMMAAEMDRGRFYPNKLLIISKAGKEPLILEVPSVLTFFEGQILSALK